MISVFAGEVGDVCILLACYVASSSNFLPTFRDNLSVQSSRVKKSIDDILGFLALEDVTDRLSRNVGKKLPLDAA